MNRTRASEPDRLEFESPEALNCLGNFGKALSFLYFLFKNRGSHYNFLNDNMKTIQIKSKIPHAPPSLLLRDKWLQVGVDADILYVNINKYIYTHNKHFILHK